MRTVNTLSFPEGEVQAYGHGIGEAVKSL
jgi:hypothetical protein